MMVVSLKVTDIVVIIGRRRSGKTFLVKNHFLPQLRSYVIDDHLGEYENFGYVTDRYVDIEDKPKVVFIDKEANDESFKSLVRAVFRRKKSFKYTVLVVDEAHIHFEKKKLPQAQSVLIRMGRHYNVGVILISQRVFDINPVVYKNADYVILFQTREPREIDFIKKYISSEIIDVVKKLPRYHFLVFDVNRFRWFIHKPIHKRV